MLLSHVDIIIMTLSCSYLGHSGDTVLASNLQFETKSEVNSGKIFTKGISFKVSSKESGVGNPE